jgi:hypothetical protein
MQNSQGVEKWKISPLPFVLERNRLPSRALRPFTITRETLLPAEAPSEIPDEVTAMKDLNRNIPAVAVQYHLAEHKEFCVCRVLEDCALIKIESLGKLQAAKKYMRRLASHIPGSYVIFSDRSKRVLERVVSRAA